MHAFHPLSQVTETLRDEIVDSLVGASLRKKEAKAGITSFSESLTTLERNNKTAEEGILSTFATLLADSDAPKKKLLGSLEEKESGRPPNWRKRRLSLRLLS